MLQAKPELARELTQQLRGWLEQPRRSWQNIAMP